MRFKGLAGVYATNALYGLAGSFVDIFIPIFLLSRTLDPLNVVWFYFVYSAVMPASFFAADRLARAWGLRRTVLASYPLIFVNFFLLYTLNELHTPLFILAVLSALRAALHWYPFHIWLAEESVEGERGKEMGKFFGYSQAVGVAAPLIAGIIVVAFGFRTLFGLSLAIYALSALPLATLPELVFRERIDVRRFRALFHEYPRYVIAELFENIREDAEAIIWPIAVYLAFKNILSIGWVGTLSGVGAALFTFFVGTMSDRKGVRKFMFAGGLIAAAVWAARVPGGGPYIAYALTLVAGFFGPLITVPFAAVIYGIAKREGAPTFILFRETLIAAARVVLYVFAFAVLPFINNVFVFTGAACVGLALFTLRGLYGPALTAVPARRTISSNDPL